MKYIIVFIYFFSCFLLITTSSHDLYYRPMTKRNENFGNDVCYYEDTATDYPYYAYVKPCEEGKKCVALDTDSSRYSEFNIHFCQEYNSEVYDNEGTTCETKDSFPGLDCTGYSCKNEEKCYNNNDCPSNKLSYFDSNDNKYKCVDNQGYCYEAEFDNSDGSRKSYTNYHSFDNNQHCILYELQETKSTSKKYQVKKKKYASIASIDDGNYIVATSGTLGNPSEANHLYCKSGYALYFYGDGKLKNPNTYTPNSESMYLRCVTVLGKDANGIIKYKIGESGDEKYYNPASTILSDGTNSYPLYGNDKYLMLRLGFFKNYKERLDKVGCSDTGDCEDNDLIKWKFFYDNPEYYYLYQNEPQVLEYLLQDYNPKYKAKYTSPDESSLLNIKYLTLLSLLLLF